MRKLFRLQAKDPFPASLRIESRVFELHLGTRCDENPRTRCDTDGIKQGFEPKEAAAGFQCNMSRPPVWHTDSQSELLSASTTVHRQYGNVTCYAAYSCTHGVFIRYEIGTSNALEVRKHPERGVLLISLSLVAVLGR